MKINSSSIVGIYYKENNNVINFTEEELEKYLRKIFGGNIEFNNNDVNVRVNLIIDSSLNLKFDGFKVEVDDNNIFITSKKFQDALYGVNF